MQEFKRKLTKAALLLPLASILTACKATAMSQAPKMTEQQRRFNNMGLALVVDAVEGAEMLGNEFFADGSDIPFYQSSVTRKGNRAIMAFPSGTVPERVRVVWRIRDNFGPSWWSNPQTVDEFGNPIKDYKSILHDRSYKSPTWQEKIEKRKLIAKNIGHVHQGPWGGRYFGEAAGDYTIPIASRIPDEVVKEIRKNGGGLRLKFRLNPNGVFFGWDIERFEGGLPRHSMPGGDFREAGPAYGLPGRLVFEAYVNPYTDTASVNPAAKPYLDTGEYFVPSRSADIWRKGWYIDKDGRKVLTDF
jgi:hypothetical protein